MTPRGSTGNHRPSALPSARYAPASVRNGTIVSFHGEDDRSRVFDIACLPLPGWHAALAESWAERVGPAGALRTQASAEGAWGALSRMMRFLGSTLKPPQTPEELTTEHVDAYIRSRSEQIGEASARLETRLAGLTFLVEPLASLVPAEVRARLRPMQRPRSNPQSGYSDGEFARIVAAARADVRVLEKRMRSLPSSSRVLRKKDLTPLLVILVALTGWNIETMKELSPTFRTIDGVAVEVDLVKRRRGRGRWHQTATWELSARPSRLVKPGDAFLAVHKLMAPPRRRLKTDRFWVIESRGELKDPFAKRLHGDLRHGHWVERHGLLADPVSEALAALPLRLNFNRLKTTVDVRRTREMGGHLPSAARSNSTSVLFRNYLAGDATTREWAQDAMSEALTDVEASAWDAHKRALGAHGRTELQILKNSDLVETSQSTEAAWTTCTDIRHHPETGRTCRRSFLDCFQCGNCVVTGEHLPRLLSLLDVLEARRAEMSEEGWWIRYGAAWVALRREVLPAFTTAELSLAEQAKPNDSHLDLVEPRWERP